MCRHTFEAPEAKAHNGPPLGSAGGGSRRVVDVRGDGSERGDGSVGAELRYRPRGCLAVDYSVKARLGASLASPVRRGICHRTRRGFACKTLAKTELGDEGLQLVRAETEIFLSVDHPHIARLHDVLETDSEVHLVMELLTGGELSARLEKRRRFHEPDAASAARHMLLAVAYLHARGVVHRDLKPDNFVYEAADSDHLKLIDFGLATRRCGGDNPDALLSQPCGTLPFMAPEVLAQAYTEKADMWSLGAVVYTLLVGSSLWPACRSDAELYEQIRQGQPRFSPLLAEASASAQDFVRQLLEVDPAHRLSSEQALRPPGISGLGEPQKPLAAEDALETLHRFGQLSPFRQYLFQMVAQVRVTYRGEVEWRARFASICDQSSGTITEMRVADLLATGTNHSPWEVADVLRGFDGKEGSGLSYSDFLAAELYRCRRVVDEDFLRSAFCGLERAGAVASASAAAHGLFDKSALGAATFSGSLNVLGSFDLFVDFFRSTEFSQQRHACRQG
mmetsp:Transcript_124056/g.396669  ORF Transcript_124056/g.396669 Transcript_124056/m.396669 type:complete len:507 (+) Transcript_124056:126-1646(+)